MALEEQNTMVCVRYLNNGWFQHKMMDNNDEEQIHTTLDSHFYETRHPQSHIL